MATLILPDGKTVPLEIMKADMGCDFILDIRELKSKAGVITYDPGLSSTAICNSGVTYIDGEEGLCMYRGYPIHEIANDYDYLDICYLLLFATPPTHYQSGLFQKKIKEEMNVPEVIKGLFKGFRIDSHPMAIMSSVVSSLAGIFPNPMELEINSSEEKEKACIRMIGKMVTIAAMVYKFSIGEPFIFPNEDYSYAENLLYMMFSHPSRPYKSNKLHVKIINTFLNLHADHEQAASTCTIRVTGSSGAPLYSCLASSISSLWGRAHGGANEAVLKMLYEIGSEKNIPEFIAQVKQKKRRLMGFGHRIYKNYDPRCILMRNLCIELLREQGTQDPYFELAMALEKIALSDEYFTSRKLYPNVDFYSGISMRALGIPTNMFTVIFAVGRSCGWVSHWKEMVEDLPIKIARPRQLYTGCTKKAISNGNFKVEDTNGSLNEHNSQNKDTDNEKSNAPVFFDYEFDIWGETSM